MKTELKSVALSKGTIFDKKRWFFAKKNAAISQFTRVLVLKAYEISRNNIIFK